jgi:hypothetical protein
MAVKELEARYVTKRAKDYKLADGEGLYLLVRTSGSELWRFVYHGRQLPSHSKTRLLHPRPSTNVGVSTAE